MLPRVINILRVEDNEQQLRKSPVVVVIESIQEQIRVVAAQLNLAN